MSQPAPRSLLTVLVWTLVAATLLVGGCRVTHLDHHSHDQKILIEKSNAH